MIVNRRNFYRTLRVQPDASSEVIQQSYRSLMQKLRLHPDLGGDGHDAGLINQAYATLRNPKIRAAYDAQLFEQYHISVLSAGGKLNASMARPNHGNAAWRNGNQRNYYRILHLQKDAEREVIKASYQTLAKQLTGESKQLLDEAFHVVGDIKRRQQYDTLLRLHAHEASVRKLKDNQNTILQFNNNARPTHRIVAQVQKANTRQEIFLHRAYSPVTKNYCPFCKAPYNDGYFMEKESVCRECASPLSLPADIYANLPRRSLPRTLQSKKANIYTNWPGRPTAVLLGDLSPTGLNFSSPQRLDTNQIIKVNASHFNAVAQVTHVKSDSSIHIIGARFLTIKFLRAAGSFVSTSA